MDIKNVFIGKAKKFNQYSEACDISNHDCKTCIRKYFSFPYTCSDGWKDINKNKNCMNWNDDPKCEVD